MVEVTNVTEEDLPHGNVLIEYAVVISSDLLSKVVHTCPNTPSELHGCVVAAAILSDCNAQHLPLLRTAAPNDMVLGVLQCEAEFLIQDKLDPMELSGVVLFDLGGRLYGHGDVVRVARVGHTALLRERSKHQIALCHAQIREPRAAWRTLRECTAIRAALQDFFDQKWRNVRLKELLFHRLNREIVEEVLHITT